MKKQLNVLSIANELKNGSRFFSPQVEDDAAYSSPAAKGSGIEVNETLIEPAPTDPSAEQPSTQSSSKSSSGSTAQSTGESTQQLSIQSTRPVD